MFVWALRRRSYFQYLRGGLKINYFFIDIVGGGVQLGPLGTTATDRPIVPAPGDCDDGEIGGMIGEGNRNTQRKPARTRTRAAAVGSQRLTA
jgi:hypothetical protein